MADEGKAGSSGQMQRGGGEQRGLARQQDFRDPFSLLRREMDRVFQDFYRGGWPPLPRMPDLDPFRGFGGGTGAGGATALTPHVDVAETEKEYRITAELPGIDEKDIEVSVADDLLTIKGEKREESRQEDKGYHVSERRYGTFQRSFRLPEGVEPDKIEAQFNRGVLQLVLPKSEKAQPRSRRIDVKSG